MTPDATRISVVIPCLNAAAFLAQAIGSVLEQDRRPDEVIVVDDGSTDGSLSIAARFAEADTAVRVCAAGGGRGGHARNVGATHATGDLLMFLDADDVIAPGTLAALSSALAGEAKALAICPWFRLVEHDGVWVRRPRSCRARAADEDPLAAWLTGWYHPPCAVMWTRAAFELAGRWDDCLTSNQDGDLVMRALLDGSRLIETGSGAGYYRRHEAGHLSVSAGRFSHRALRDRLRVVRKVAFRLHHGDRLHPYRHALRDAFRQIGATAGEQGYTDLQRRASRLAAHYGPGARWPGAVRWGRRPGGSTSAEPPESGPVAWGLAEAARLLPAVAAPVPGYPSPCRRPAVSVIIPTFNRAGTVGRALDTVLAQTFGDLEVLVVDDGSTDDTAAVVRRRADARVRYLPQPANAGVAAARNRGLREARGDLVAFLDSDDEWRRDKLALQVGIFARGSEELGLVYTGVECVLTDGRSRLDRPEARGDVYRAMLARNVVHGGGSNVMMRRAVVATVGFFDERLRAIEDYEYWLRIARFFRFDYVDAPLVRYHDAPAAHRRSRAVAANLAAREWLFRKYGPEMRRARVAHLYLLKSMRRALHGAEPDVRAARLLALRAVREAPASRAALGGLLHALRARAPAGGPA